MIWIFFDHRSSSVWIFLLFNFSLIEIFVEVFVFFHFSFFWPHLDLLLTWLVNFESENFSNQVGMFLLQMMNNHLSIFEVTKTEFAFQRPLIPPCKFSQIFFSQLIWRFNFWVHYTHNWTRNTASELIGRKFIAQTTKKIWVLWDVKKKFNRFINQWLRERVTRQNRFGEPLRRLWNYLWIISVLECKRF